MDLSSAATCFPMALATVILALVIWLYRQQFQVIVDWVIYRASPTSTHAAQT